MQVLLQLVRRSRHRPVATRASQACHGVPTKQLSFSESHESLDVDASRLIFVGLNIKLFLHKLLKGEQVAHELGNTHGFLGASEVTSCALNLGPEPIQGLLSVVFSQQT